MLTNNSQLKVLAGDRLDTIVKEAVALARETGETVRFTFNNTMISVPPGLPTKKVLASATARCLVRLY